MTKVLHRLRLYFTQLDTLSIRLSAAIIFVCVVSFTLMAWSIRAELANDGDEETLEQLVSKLAMIPQLNKAGFSDEQLQELLQTLFIPHENHWSLLSKHPLASNETGATSNTQHKLKRLLEPDFSYTFIYQTTTDTHWKSWRSSLDRETPSDPEREEDIWQPSAASSVYLPDRDRWLNIGMGRRDNSLADELGYLTYVIGLFMLVCIACIVLVVHRTTRPLAGLTHAARRFGDEGEFKAVPIVGTREIRETIGTFNTMGQSLSNSYKERLQFLSAVSHDLRSPLTGVRLQAEFIDTLEVKTAIINGVSEMEQLTDALLQYVKSGEEPQQGVSIDLEALLNQLTQAYRDQREDLSLSSSQPCIVYASKLELNRLCRNIIENALNYGQRARITLKVCDAKAIVTVDDDGPGFELADQHRLFLPFQRANSSQVARNKGGIGLGLAVAKQICNALQGEITLNNREENGKIFGASVTIQLPLRLE